MGGDDNERACRSAPPSRRYDHVLLDLDGCLWVGDDAIDGARRGGRRAARGRQGHRVHDERRAPRARPLRAQALAARLPGELDEVVTCGAALQFVLAERQDGGAAFVIGSQALVDHVADAGLRIVNNTEFATRADVVVVAGHEDFDFRELRIATQAVLRGAELIGVTRDRTFPMPDGPWPGSGAVLAAVEAATGQRAERTVGKPEPDMYAAARDRLGAGPLPRGRRPARHRRRRRAARGDRQRARPHRRHGARRGGRAPTRSPRTWPTRSPRSCSGALLAFCASMARRPLCLIVNPSAGRGRAERLLPAVEAALRRARHAVPRRAHATRSPTRASWPARRSRAARSPRDGRRRPARRDRRRAARDRRRARRPARRPRQRLRAQARDRAPTRSSRATSCRRARARDRRRRRRRADLPRDRVGRLRLRRPGHRERDARPARRRRSTSTRRCARCAAGATRAGRSWSTARRTPSRGYSVAVANSGVFGGGMHFAPRRVARRRPARRRARPRVPQARASCARCRRCSRARTSTARTSRSCAPRRSRSTSTGRSPLRGRRSDRGRCPSPSRSCRAR